MQSLVVLIFFSFFSFSASSAATLASVSSSTSGSVFGASVSVLTCKEDPAPEDISEGDEMDIQAKRLPNSTSSASASASEDSSLSLTDSDRTLLGDPPESEEADNLSDAGSSSNQRRNAVIQVEDSSVNTSATVKHFFKVRNLTFLKYRSIKK